MLTHLVALQNAAQNSDNQYEWLWGLGVLPVVLIFALWLAAAISIIKSRFRGWEKFLFILGTLAFPILGPLIWFIFIKRERH